MDLHDDKLEGLFLNCEKAKQPGFNSKIKTDDLVAEVLLNIYHLGFDGVCFFLGCQSIVMQHAGGFTSILTYTV